MIVKSVTGAYEGLDSDGIIKFLGIRYALPPVGDLRFRRAMPVLQTNRKIETMSFTPKAPQPSAGLLSADIQVPMSEDCLYLHI